MLLYFDSFQVLRATSWLHADYPQLQTQCAAEVVSTLLSGDHGQGVIADSLALHSNCSLWSGLVTAACTLAAQLLEVAPSARLSSSHLPQLSSEDSTFHLQSPNAELSDLDADASAKAGDGQQQWQSDKAAVPSVGVALPHKIVVHMASHEQDIDQSAWAAVWKLYSGRPGIAGKMSCVCTLDCCSLHRQGTDIPDS